MFDKLFGPKHRFKDPLVILEQGLRNGEIILEEKAPPGDPILNGGAQSHDAAKHRAEISYDLVMKDDMQFVEGAYRLPGAEWRVLIVSRCDVPEPQVVAQVWESGAEGVLVRFPRGEALDKLTVERVLKAALGVSEWVQVRGPDSMRLR